MKKRERVEGGMWFSRGETRDLGEDREGGLHQIPVAEPEQQTEQNGLTCPLTAGIWGLFSE